MWTRCVIVATALTLAARGEIIDRLAVTLDNQVITDSEIRREIRLTAFLNGDPLDFSPDARRKAAERLIEQKLIRKEIALGRYVQPDLSAADPLLAQVKAQRFRTQQEYEGALARYGITENQLRAYLLWQATLVRFVELRFRPGVQVSEEEIREQMATRESALKHPGADGADAEALRKSVEQALIEKRIDREMDQWLQETKKHTRIEFREDAFQ